MVGRGEAVESQACWDISLEGFCRWLNRVRILCSRHCYADLKGVDGKNVNLGIQVSSLSHSAGKVRLRCWRFPAPAETGRRTTHATVDRSEDGESRDCDESRVAMIERANSGGGRKG